MDEVLQAVAMAAVEQRAPLSDPARLAPWLYRLAIYQVLMYRRSAGRRRKLEQRVANRLPPVEHDTRNVDPLEWMLADESRRLVREGLSRLGERDREILLFKYVEEWSYREIASHMGLSESAIEARLHRARARLRDELAALNVVEVARS